MESTAKKIEDADKQASKKSASAEQKRIQSIIEMKKNYQKQKNTIKTALSRVDTSSNKKIIFDDEAENTYNTENTDKKALFSDEENDKDDTEYNFTVKDYLTGKKGKKLMELQSKFKNDKRFTMDEKFLDDGEENEGNAMEIEESNQNGEKHSVANIPEDEDMDITEEKQKEMSILENILGEKIRKRDTGTHNKKSYPLHHYDPSNTEFDKYLIKEDEPLTEKKKKRKKENREAAEGNEETKKPQVSKETFYEIKENLKDTLEDNQSFSFLNMFNSHPVVEKETNESNEINHNTANLKQKDNRNHNFNQENPFRYDSSEESDNDEKHENKDESGNQAKDQDNDNKSSSRLWTESFFFKEDDYRFQEGLDFVKKFELDDKSEFKEVRRNIRQIVRDKVRHNQRRNRPFKKKLGGKRMIKIKKALKNK